MDIDPSITQKTIATVPALRADNKRSAALLFVVIFVTVFSLTPLLALL